MTTLVPVVNLEPLVALVTNSVTSPCSKLAYAGALRRFFVWYNRRQPGPISRAVVQEYRAHMESIGQGPVTINTALYALRALAREAAEGGMLDEQVAAGIQTVKTVKILGTRAGNWLTRPQLRTLLDAPDTTTLIGKRDKVILCLLAGCGLRRNEAATLTVDRIQERSGRPALVDFMGKGGRVRTVGIPRRAYPYIQDWLDSAGITEGRVLRPFHPKSGKIHGDRIGVATIWLVVKEYAQRALGVNLAPHDLRRTFSALSDNGGAPLKKIQHALGHSSEKTTGRYLQASQDLQDAACDYLGVFEG